VPNISKERPGTLRRLELDTIFRVLVGFAAILLIMDAGLFLYLLSESSVDEGTIPVGPLVTLGKPIISGDAVEIPIEGARPEWSLDKYSTMLLSDESHTPLIPPTEISKGVYMSSDGISIEFADHNNNGKLDRGDSFCIERSA